ncbi:cupin domain-containing protein [Caballeronia sp. GAFFF1]|uniref:cupin domain-containing protein n=1 Tax=Caballeronia sp. GAFFF1 TaxID=2921779 RepID=UPI0020292E30|nr:cupin domain-containing protein [Caballeronia sp. GAFFF1]
MLRDAFLAQLSAEGFHEVVTVTREPDVSLDLHAHPFEAKALIVEGEITLCVGGEARLYRAGDVFHLPANVEHSEQYGPQGVSYLVGRK